MRRVQLPMEILLITTYHIILVLTLGSKFAYHVLLPSPSSLILPTITPELYPLMMIRLPSRPHLPSELARFECNDCFEFSFRESLKS